MDITALIAPLNEPQREAVCSDTPTVLVLAGAGSGKTRVLVHRIAWLISAINVPPQRILAVTFTNKAAQEMRFRIERLLNLSTRELWIGTFHGLAHRLLRRHALEAKLPPGFQIIDSGDQLRVIKRLLKSLEIDESRWPPKQLLWYINGLKDEGRRARHLAEASDPFERQMQRVYRSYEELCDRSGLVDFAELLLRALELLRDDPALLDFYQRKFEHVLVDEFQDTNKIQYAWLRLLTQPRDNLFAVGDDDQSIYSWRGALVENLQHFQTDYPHNKLVRLEQNYRSTGHILAAANALITHNQDRLGKHLWTEDGSGEPLSLYAAFNEVDEAYFVANRVQSWASEGNARSDAAILYRSNAQSRQFEEKLMAMNIPYRVYGGLRFFERQEIKDALAYLRLLINPKDDAAFERIINTPPRGIGAKMIDTLRLFARKEETTLWEAMLSLIESKELSARAKNPLIHFRATMAALLDSTEHLALAARTHEVIQQTGLLAHYRKEKGEQAEQRVENLEELITAARQFEIEPTLDPDMPLMDQFLSHAALESGENQSEPATDCVQLMTLHAAKGLEFDLVFLVGLEEGLFPSLQSMEDLARLEEERRLCYVGITRAKQRLVLSYAESRRLYGKETYPRPSRFIREIPSEHLQEIRARTPPSPQRFQRQESLGQHSGEAGLRMGQRVCHGKFGEGVILQAEGEGSQARVQVNFSDSGVKWLMVNVAKLEAL
ncbi:MAG: DNA helicase II [Methylococcus sp.]|nr:MAG: DNA helicase II [Methylococcus sp.]